MSCRVVHRFVPLCILASGILASSWAWAQSDAATYRSSYRYHEATLPIEVERSEGSLPIFVLGVNRFTFLQLSAFIAGVETFLIRAEADRRGSQLIWRQEGLRGYVSLSTSPFAEGPAFLLTLRGEPVRTYGDADAVLGTVSLLGMRLLAATRPLPPAGQPGARPAPRLEFTR